MPWPRAIGGGKEFFMSSNFDANLESGDIIEAAHVNQYAEPVKELESGKAFYRVATGTGAPYSVDFTADPDPDVRNNHISTTAYDPDNALMAGQIVTFKASADSPANASLRLKLEDGAGGTDSADYPLHAGDDQIGAGQIKEDQIVVAVFNDEGRFDVVGVTPGASAIDDLEDVTSSSPQDLEILQYDDATSSYVNRSLGMAGIATDAQVTSLQTALNNQVHDAADIVSGTLPIARGGTGGADAAAARTSMDVPSNADLTGGLAGKADSTHVHSADDITSGTLPIARGGTGGADAAAARTSLDVPSNADLTGGLAGKADSTHVHSASAITSGELTVERGGTGADLSATGGTGHVLKQDSYGGAISVGPLSVGDMPSNIGADKIGSGSVSDTEFEYLDGVTSSVQGQLDVHTGDINANSSAISGKQDTLTDISDVPGLSVTSPQDGQLLHFNSNSGDFENSSADAAGLVEQSRTISTTAPLSGGGDLSSDLSLSMPAADSSGQDGYLTSVKFAEFEAKEDAANKGQADGYAELDSSGKVPLGRIPDHEHDASDIVSGTLAVAQGGVPTGGSDGQVLGYSSSAPAWIDVRPSDILIVETSEFGTGADGAVVFSSDTTITSDLHATTLIIDSGVTVSVGWNSSEGRAAAIFATTSVTVNGHLSADGGSGHDASPEDGAGGSSLTGGGGGGGRQRYSTSTPGPGGISQRPGADGSDGTSAQGGVINASNRVLLGSFSDLLVVDLAGSGGNGGTPPKGGDVGGGGGGGGGTIYLISPILLGDGILSANGGNISRSGSLHPRVGEAGGIVLCAESISANLLIEARPGLYGDSSEKPLPGILVLVSPSVHCFDPDLTTYRISAAFV